MFHLRRVLVAGTTLALIHVAVLSPIFAQTQFLGLAQQRATVSIDFPGGSLTEFLSQLAAEIESRPDLICNIVTSNPEGAQRVAVPEISLKHVSIEGILNVVSSVADSSQFQVMAQSIEESSDNSTFVVQVSPSPVKRPPERRLEVLSVQELVGDAKGENQDEREDRLATVLTAIDTALELQYPEEQKKTLVRFHSDSGLLFVSGRQDQIELIRTVIIRIEEGRKPARALAELESRNTQLRDFLTASEARLNDREAFSQAQFDEMRVESGRLQADLATTKIRSEETRRLLDDLRARHEAEIQRLEVEKAELRAELRKAEAVISRLQRPKEK